MLKMSFYFYYRAFSRSFFGLAGEGSEFTIEFFSLITDMFCSSIYETYDLNPDVNSLIFTCAPLKTIVKKVKF